MNVLSSSVATCSDMCWSTGSSCMVAVEPPRSSSQFADQEMLMSPPVSSDFGRATGVCCPCGDESSMSYS
ncbi:Uncharacterised protein [Mycobacteroides abscessus]|nr:Uncharacterised protein [Mycobacteroides abscessus]